MCLFIILIIYFFVGSEQMPRYFTFNIPDEDKDDKFSIHSFVSYSLTDDEDVPQFAKSQEEERMLAIRKVLREYKAIFVATEMKSGLDKFVADTTLELQLLEKQKTQRFNRPSNSLFDFFKTNNKIQPDSTLPLKPLPAVQAAEYTLAKDILANVIDYILEQRNLLMMVNALKNIARYKNDEAIFTGDPRDIEISLYTTIDDLKKGRFHFPTDQPDETGKSIKDGAVLKILRHSAESLETYAAMVEHYLQQAMKRVDNVMDKHVDETFEKLAKSNQTGDISRMSHESKLNVILTSLPKADFVTLLREINTSLISYKPSPEPTATPDSTPRRNNWMP
jgi:hypothetical protein